MIAVHGRKRHDRRPGTVQRRSRWITIVMACGLLAAPAAAAGAPTTVSLTFDDGQATQFQMRSLLSTHGMRATFFVNSALVGTSPFRMPWEQLALVASDGNEVTGHTLTHRDLTLMDDSEKRSEICDDRANIVARGFFPVRSFAYPLGRYDAATQAIVAECGYTSARKVGALFGGPSCGACPPAETLPPVDPLATRTVEAAGATTTLSDLQGSVTRAEPAGGWVQFLFHGVCNTTEPCADDEAIRYSVLADFLAWLAPRSATGTVVRTVAEAMGAGASGYGSTTPPPPPPPAPPTPAPAPAPPAPAPAPPALAPPPFAAKLEISRATVSRSSRRLSVLAPITGRASGEVKAAFQAAGRTDRFSAKIDAAKRRVLIDRRISEAQARLGTGILTLTYAGDADTQPQEVRLRAASRPADLKASRPTISNGRLIASGEISQRARGVVRLQLLYEPAGQQTRTLGFAARIRNGRYRFSERLPAEVLTGIAQRRGVVHSYTLFTGYFPTRVRGEMSSFQVLGAR